MTNLQRDKLKVLQWVTTGLTCTVGGWSEGGFSFVVGIQPGRQLTNLNPQGLSVIVPKPRPSR